MNSYKKYKFNDILLQYVYLQYVTRCFLLERKPLQPNIHFLITRSFLKLLVSNSVCRSAIAGPKFYLYSTKSKNGQKVAQNGQKLTPFLSVFGIFWPLLASFSLCVENINAKFQLNSLKNQ